MKKLNNKGYMLVEIILASAIAFIMAFFLIDMTVKLVNKNNDYYTASKLLVDRNIVTKEIMDDINSRNLIKVIQESNNKFTFAFDDGEEKNLEIFEDTNTIKYGDYEKVLSNKLIFENVTLTLNEENKIFTFKMPAYTNYSLVDYGLNIVIKYQEELEIKLPENCKNIIVKYGSTTLTSTGTVTLDYETANLYDISVNAGTYVMEAWGAQGASSSRYEGGKGGFINGKLNLTTGKTLTVKIGGQDGTNGGGSSIGEGSYNGGGATTVSLDGSVIMTAGGGSGANDNFKGNDGGSGDGSGANNGTNGGGGSSKEVEYDDGTDNYYCRNDAYGYCIPTRTEDNDMWCYCSVSIGAGNSPPDGYTCGSASGGYKTCTNDYRASFDEQKMTDKGIGNGGLSSVNSLIINSSKSDGVNKGNGKFTISCSDISQKPSVSYPSGDNVVDNAFLANNTISEQKFDYSEPKMTEVTLGYGTYIFEVWGAQGKNYERTITVDGEKETYIGKGGKGGYSKGTLTLTKDTNVFVYVGGSGGNETAEGFNGGGAYGGGGASDIRIDTDSLYARVIVAGGGGSGSGSGNKETGINTYDGGYGGGESGRNGTGTGGNGGKQTEPGGSRYDNSLAYLKNDSYGTLASFGIGGGYNSTADKKVNGGGGGFYGGGFSSYGAGGGSGYVYTKDTASNYPTGCLLNSTYYLTDATTISGNTSFTDFDGTTVTGHSGDGAVRITALPKYLIPRIIFDKDELTISYGKLVNLDNGVSYKCEDSNPGGCTYLGTGIADTSTIERGTYYLSYRIKASNGNIYTYPRKLIVN